MRPIHTVVLANAVGLVLAVVATRATAQEERTNAFGDPFGQATNGMAGCPEPLGPLFSTEEARREAHWRAERGTSCYLSGRCRLPNAYQYDAEIFPRAIQYLRQSGRFDDTSIWLGLERRWVFVRGCVQNEKQGAALEAELRLVDDVEAVVGQWMVGIKGTPPYKTTRPASAR